VSQVNLFLALAFSVVIAIFAVQNTTPVGVQFLTFRAETVAVSVLVLIAAAFGAAAMLSLSLAREVSARWRQRALAQQLKTAQARVAQLEGAASSSQPSTQAVSGQPSTASRPVEAPAPPTSESESEPRRSTTG
jgi:putative membrane protein